MSMSEQLDMQISAFLDGVLASDEAAELEQRSRNDPAIAARIDGMRRANSMARDYFDSELNEPVPLALARAIEGSASARQRVPVINDISENIAVTGRDMAFVIRAIAASLALLVAGAVGGYAVATWPGQTQVAQDDGWLRDVAGYHRVYAAEKRHLVEVAANEQPHLETWLTNVVGVPVKAPDLTAQGLTFEGGRLLVAASKPVAQLMYRHPDGRVVALCVIMAADKTTGEFVDTTVSGTRMVSWKENGAAYVVIGDADDGSLPEIARAAASLV